MNNMYILVYNKIIRRIITITILVMAEIEAIATTIIIIRSSHLNVSWGNLEKQ